MKKNITLVLLSSLFLGCSVSNINTLPLSKPTSLIQPTLLTNSIISNSPVPSKSINLSEQVKVKNIYAFPNNLVLNEDETKSIYAKVKMSDGSQNNDYIIKSENSDIVIINDYGLVQAVKEGVTNLKVFSKNDPSKIVNIPLEVKNINYPNRLKNKSFQNFEEIELQDLYNDNDDIITYTYSKYNKENRLFYLSSLNPNESNQESEIKNYKESQDLLYELHLKNQYIENKFIVSNNKNNIIALKAIHVKDIPNSYDLYANIFENNLLKTSVKISDIPLFYYDGPYEQGYGYVYRRIEDTFLAIDDNGNFTVLWKNKLNELRMRAYDKDGKSISPYVILGQRVNGSFQLLNFDVSPNLERIIFTEYIKENSKEIIKAKIFDKNLNKLLDKTILTYTNSNKDNTSYYSDYYRNISVSINDSGELNIAWNPYYDTKKIFIQSFNPKGESKCIYNLENNNDSNVSDISLNNKGNLVVVSELIPSKGLDLRYLISENNKEYFHMKKGESYLLDARFSKYISSNENVVKVEGNKIISVSEGTVIINGIDENNYENNSITKVNILPTCN